jgi:hypothetical protein
MAGRVWLVVEGPWCQVQTRPYLTIGVRWVDEILS